MQAKSSRLEIMTRAFRSFGRGRPALAGAAAGWLILTTGLAQAQTEYDWTGAGTWSTGANWVGGNAPPAGGSNAFSLGFGGSTAFTANNDLAGVFVLNQLLLSNTVVGVTNQIVGNRLLLTNSPAAVAPQALQTAGGACTISTPVTLAVGTTLGGDGAYAELSGNVDGAAGLTKAGAGTWALSGSNTYAGGTVVAAGTLDVRSAAGLPVSPVTVSNGASLLFRNAVGPVAPIAISMAGKTAYASTNALQAASLAIDGNAATRWESQQGIDPQWWYVDLGQTYSLNQVQIEWETAMANDFSIQVSDSTNNPPGGAGWTTVYATNNNPAVNAVFYTYPLSAGASGRYVAMYGNTRKTVYGYSMYEFRVFTSGTSPLTFAVTALTGDSAATVDLGVNDLVLGGSGVSGIYAGAITGATAVAKTGASTQWLVGASSYAGGTIVSNGTLGIAQDASLGATGTAVMVNGATLEATNAVVLSRRPLSLTNSAVLAVDAQSALVCNGAIGGMGPLTKNGAGTLLLAAVNTYNGGTLVNAGTLSVTNANTGNLGVGGFAVVQPGAILEFARGDIFGANNTTPAFALTNNGGTIINTLTTYNTLGPVTLNGGTLASIGGNSVGYQAYQFRSPVTVIGDAASWMTSSGANSGFHLAPSGTVFNVGAGAAPTNLIVSARLILPNVALGQTGGGVIKTGAGTMALTGANTYSGQTIVNQGRLIVSSDSNFGQAPTNLAPSNVVINGGALSIGGTFAMNANRGVVVGPTNGNGAGIIDVASNQTLSINGPLQNNGGGMGGLTKTGAGSLFLGTNAVYSGPTVISAGTLQIGPPAAPPAGNMLWLDATRGVLASGGLTNGATVTAWSNQGSGGDAVYGSATYATAALNGLPMLRFDGVSQSLTSRISAAYANTNATLALFMVDRRKTNTIDFAGPMSFIGTGHTVDWSDSATLALDWGTVAQNPGLLRSYRVGPQSATAHPAFGTAYSWDTIFDGVNNQLFLNGTAATAVGSTGNFAIDRVSVGSRLGAAGPNSYFSGDIGEVLVYNGAVNRPLVEAYLAAKWFGAGFFPNLLPTNTTLSVAAGAAVSFSVNQGVSAVSGSGQVAGSGVLTAGALQPGGINAVGTLTIDNLAITSGATYTWDYQGASNDLVVVNQAVSLPSTMTVAVNGLGVGRPQGATILTFGTNTGAQVLNWTVTGGAYTVRLLANSVVLSGAGSVLMIQ